MKNLLIVEDDYFIRDIYNETFSKAGYAVDLAVDGEEALDKMKQKSYDMVLLDIMLPRITGLDVLRALRATNSAMANIPVILLTNLGQDNIIKEAFEIGADGYLLKAQLKPQEVVKEVEVFFAKQKQGEEK